MRLAETGLHEVPAGRIAAVVTCLEMREPPQLPAVEPPPGTRLRHWQRPEPERYRELYRAVGERWLWFSRLLLSDEALRAILHDPAVEVRVVETDGRAVGLLELDRRCFPEIELAFFGLVPACTGRGYGRWLIAEAVRLAFAHGPSRFWVHTCTLDHPAALPLYIRSGFTPYARFVEIAEDPRLTGLLSRDVAPHVPLIEAP